MVKGVRVVGARTEGVLDPVADMVENGRIAGRRSQRVSHGRAEEAVNRDAFPADHWRDLAEKVCRDRLVDGIQAELDMRAGADECDLVYP
jgi:hypothetical protein